MFEELTERAHTLECVNELLVVDEWLLTQKHAKHSWVSVELTVVNELLECLEEYV